MGKSKKIIAAIIAAVLLSFNLAAITAQAADIGVVNTVTNITERKGTVDKTATLYVGEIIVDDQTKIKYVYSDDVVNCTLYLGGTAEEALSTLDRDFADLYLLSVAEYPEVIAACSDESYASKMNASWKNAADAAAELFPDLNLTSSSSEDLYEKNAAFAAVCLGDEEAQSVPLTDVSGNAYERKGIMAVRSTSSSDTITYTVIDGQLVKNIDRSMRHYCEDITVIYTKAVLETPTTENNQGNTPEPDGNNEPDNSDITDDSTATPETADKTDNTSPQTGENSGMMLFIIIGLASVFAAATLYTASKNR